MDIIYYEENISLLTEGLHCPKQRKAMIDINMHV